MEDELIETSEEIKTISKKQKKDIAFRDFILPYLISQTLPEKMISMTLVSKFWYKVLNSNIRWKTSYLQIYGNTFNFFASLSSLRIICDIPNEIWRQEYIFRFLAVRKRCSFCYRYGAFTDGEFFNRRGVCICESCWGKVVCNDEKKDKIIAKSFAPENLERLSDMDIAITPSFMVHTVAYYLKCDVENFASLGGGETEKKEKQSWRGMLKNELMNAGLSESLAKDYSYKSFPSDGTRLQDLIDQILMENNMKEVTKEQVNEELLKEKNIIKEKKKRRIITSNERIKYRFINNRFLSLSTHRESIYRRK